MTLTERDADYREDLRTNLASAREQRDEQATEVERLRAGIREWIDRTHGDRRNLDALRALLGNTGELEASKLAPEAVAS